MARRRLRRRLQLSLALLVVATATAASVPFVVRRPVDDASMRAAHAEAGITAVLRLSISVRDAYAHQAHVFILNDPTHVEHYRETAGAMRASLDAAHRAVSGTKAATYFPELDKDALALDEKFTREVVPRIGGDRAALLGPAEEAIVRVEHMQAVIDKAAKLLSDERDEARGKLERAMQTSRETSGAVLLLALLVALGAAVIIDRSLSRPLGRLEAATDALASGDLQARVSNDIALRDDELGSLATRFNTMAERLLERETRLIESERLAVIGRLAAGVAHEINNPLGVILGHARLLEPRLDDEGKKDIDAIVLEVSRGKEIVAGLLDLSRPPRLRIEPVDLEELCKEADELKVSPSIEVKRHGNVSVDADADKLRQIMMNLFKNSREARASRISVYLDGTASDRVTMSVADDGEGLEPSAAQKLFTPFFTTKADGTGLGLSVSRAIASAHGGELQYVQTERGARFDLVIPRHAPPGAAS